MINRCSFIYWTFLLGKLIGYKILLFMAYPLMKYKRSAVETFKKLIFK